MRANYIHLEEQVAEVLGRSIHGDFAEIGVWWGTTFLPLAEKCRLNGRQIHAVDSFQGMAESTERDGKHFQKGALSVGGSQHFRKLVQPFSNVHVHEGWVPDVLNRLRSKTFAFVHLDLDQYRPTVEALDFLWPRMAEGGIIQMHDWFPDRNDLASGGVKDWLEANRVELAGEQNWSHHCWVRK